MKRSVPVHRAKSAKESGAKPRESTRNAGSGNEASVELEDLLS